MNLSPEKKIAGVLAPLFGLRRDNDLGIGDLEALREFIDWAAETGFRLVQMLPINETGGDNSPYNAISSRAIEPTTLHLAPGSPRELTQDDFDAALSYVDLAKMRRGSVKYPKVKQLKLTLLESAFERFDYPAAFEEFLKREAAWLDQYSLFRALMERNDGSESWESWPEEHRSFQAAMKWLRSLNQEERNHIDQREMFFCYVQWIAHQQWSEVRRYANERDVALMGDIPFGISYCSADVWAKPDNFRFDWWGGAPPEPYFKDDEFTQKWGQNWGIPLYNWDEMRKNNFAWWRERVRGVRRLFDAFRVDHVLGFYRIYSFPWRPMLNKEFLPLEWHQMLEKTGGRAPHFAPRNDEGHDNSVANQHDGEEYLRVVLEEAGSSCLIGEDLGTVPNYVRPNLRSLGIAGFKIPQWEEQHGRIRSGNEYERLSVATYATHDHKPVRALWEETFEQLTSTSGQALGDLQKIANFAGFQRGNDSPEFEKDFYPVMMEALFKSESWIAVVMITDLLARKYRFNVPGTATNANWTRRMQRSVAELKDSPKEQKRMKLIRELLEKSGRV